jgi:glc operon protein GlcG
MKPILICAAMLAVASTSTHAQRMPYGAPLTLEQAKRVAAVAEQEARRVSQPLGVTIAIHDAGCNLLLLQRMDNTNLGTVNIAQDKSYTACAFRTSTKPAMDMLKGGSNGMIFTQLRGFTAVEGGMPIIVDGHQVGSIGISGGTSEQDHQIATLAAQTGLKP